MGRATLLAPPQDVPALTDLLHRHFTLYDAARTLPVLAELRGRGVALLVDLAGQRAVVRHYQRGGAVARALGDRYVRFAPNRVLQELQVSEFARSRSVPTPRVLCAAWYTEGVFHRFDIATEYVAGARDLSAVLFGDAAPSEPVLTRVAQLIRTMLDAGLVHRDLNVKNILVGPDRAYVLDLDRCAITERVDGTVARAMRERFFRSVNKWEAATGRRVHDVARNQLSEAFGG